MKQKLLEALKTKFSGVDPQILDRIAAKKVEALTDENQLTSVVDGIAFQDVLQSYGDYRAGDASNTAVRNYEKKYNLKEGKIIEAIPADQSLTSRSQNSDEMPEWAKVLIDRSESLAEKIVAIENAKAQDQRMAAIQMKAKEYSIPESIARRYAIPENADLDEYFKDVKQELANLGFQEVKAPQSVESGIKEESSFIADAINAGTEKIVEQSKN